MSTDPSLEAADLIDTQNRVVGYATRGEIRQKNLLHRGVGILCWNPAGEIYIHQRTATKDLFPSLYDMFVGGMVGAGETFVDAARREVGEELGILRPEPEHLFDHLYQGPHNRAWVGIYQVTWDGPIVHQQSEVAWGQWMALPELVARLSEWEWVPDGLEIFQRYLEGRQGVLKPTPPHTA